MEKQASLERINKVFVGVVRVLPQLSIAIMVAVFVVLTYLAVFPRLDEGVQAAGNTEVESLNIVFDAKLLKELANTSQSTSVSESGGRDPFSPF